MQKPQTRKVYFSEKHAKNLGWIAGSIIPCIIFCLKVLTLYGEANKAWKGAMCALIAGGLAYSAPTVQNLIYGMLSASMVKIGNYEFNSATIKAWGFTVLLEGALVVTPLSGSTGDNLKILLLVIAYMVSFASLAFLAGVNGYCMAELAINRFVRASERSNKPANKKKDNLRSFPKAA